MSVVVSYTCVTSNNRSIGPIEFAFALSFLVVVPHVELRIECRITFDFTCSDVYRFVDELVEAIIRGGVFLEAIPQTLKISNDKGILIVGSVFVVVTVHVIGQIPWVKVGLERVNGFAAGNLTVPPAFIL